MHATSRAVATGRVVDGTAIVIALVAVVVRLAWGLAMQPSPTAVLSDANWYHSAANLLTLGYGYVNFTTLQPTALWPPGYPLLLAAMYCVLGPDPRVALALNAVAGGITVIAMWLLSLRITGSRRAAVATGVVIAFFPSHVFFSALVLTEPVFTAMLCVLALSAGVLLESPHTRLAPWLAWGAGIGLATLVRSESVVLAIVPGIVALVSRAPRRIDAPLRITAAVLVAMAVVLLPWTYRNLATSGSFVPTSTNFGRTLWIGHNPEATGGMSVALRERMDATIEQEYRELRGPVAEVARNRRYLREAMSWAVTHPGRELQLLALRAYHFWRGDHAWSSWYRYTPGQVTLRDRTRVWLERLSNVYFAIVLLAGIAGYVATLRSPQPTVLVVHVIIAGWVLMYALIYGDPRFHFALLPLLVLLGVDASTRVSSVRSLRGGAARATGL